MQAAAALRGETEPTRRTALGRNRTATPASTKAALSDGFRLAGVAGFEPTMEESKSSALTTRRYP